MSAPARPRDHARGLAILLVLLVQGILALPIPRGLKRADFDDPRSREESAAVRALLGDLGLPLRHEELADGLFALSERLRLGREAALAPAWPILRLLGINQAWGLFTYPDTQPSRLVVEGRAAEGPWQRLYAGHDDEADLLAPLFRYRRLRGVYDGQAWKPGGNYSRFTQVAARRVFELRPDLQQVRIGFERFHVRQPGRALDPSVTRVHFRTIRRAELP